MSSADTITRFDHITTSRSRHLWLVLGITVLMSLALRLPGLDGTLWIDEAGSIAQASAPDFWASARQDVHPPLYYLLLRAGLEFTSSVPLLRLFSVGCGAALAVLAAWSLRSSLTAAIIAGAIGAALPELVHHSQQLRPYAPLYLLLSVALVLAAQLVSGKGGVATQCSLSLVLGIAAATHLVTAFFLLALTPLLLGAAQGRPWARLASIWPLVPAGLLLLWFKFAFVTQPKDLTEGWWIPATSARGVLSALSEVAGWDNVQWLADACARRLLIAGWGVPLLAIGAVTLSFTTAWAHAQAGSLRALLFFSALVYGAALVTYAVLFEPIVLARTLLPGLLPLCAGMAWGIGHHPVPWRRWVAAMAVIVYLTLAILPSLRKSYSPISGLRGLAGAMSTAQRPDDTIILFHALDYGLAPYWPQLPTRKPVLFDPTRPTPPQILALRTRLDALPLDGRVWLAYRDDYYFRRNPAAYNAVCEEIAAHHRAIRVFWHELDFTALLAEPVAR